MTAFSELVIVDVGHGNCAMVQHEGVAIVIDAPSKPVVAQTLHERGVTEISALVISHADSDHLSGAIALLTNENRPVREVFVNPDSRAGLIWKEFRQAIAYARKRGTVVNTDLSITTSGKISLAGTTLRIVHPPPEMCLGTVGGADVDGFAIDANNMSAVVLVEHDGHRVCLLAADTNRRSLDMMSEAKLDLGAQVLVFPHHGGHAATSDNLAFAREFVTAVQPSVVLFSLGRGSHNTPRPEIVAGVRQAMSADPPYIACTQLSTRCSAVVPATGDRGLNPGSDGFKQKKCCSGTLTMRLGPDAGQSLRASLLGSHSDFVAAYAPTALCRRQ